MIKENFYRWLSEAETTDIKENLGNTDLISASLNK